MGVVARGRLELRCRASAGPAAERVASSFTFCRGCRSSSQRTSKLGLTAPQWGAPPTDRKAAASPIACPTYDCTVLSQRNPFYCLPIRSHSGWSRGAAEAARALSKEKLKSLTTVRLRCFWRHCEDRIDIPQETADRLRSKGLSSLLAPASSLSGLEQNSRQRNKETWTRTLLTGRAQLLFNAR